MIIAKATIPPITAPAIAPLLTPLPLPSSSSYDRGWSSYSTPAEDEIRGNPREDYELDNVLEYP